MMTNPTFPDLPHPIGRAYLVGYFNIHDRKLKEIGFYSCPAESLSWSPDGMRAVTLLRSEVPIDDWTKGYTAAMGAMPKILSSPFFYWLVEAVLAAEVDLRDLCDLPIFHRAEEERLRANTLENENTEAN